MKTENLVQLLGGYFHEDWVLDHSTAEECLDQMLEEAPLQQQREGAAEIARLLSGRLCENQIRDVLLYEVGCAYTVETDGYDASSWLRHVHGRLLDSIKSAENGASGV